MYVCYACVRDLSVFQDDQERGDDLVVMGIETYKYNNPDKDYVNDM